MQNQSKISASRKTERIRSAHTPDRSEMRNMDIKTMSVSYPKKNVRTSRISTIQPSTSSANLRKIELENNNLELELMYSKYVASYAELLLEKKMLKDTEISFDNSIKKLYKETKSLLENLKMIETRINDVKALSCLNDYLDNVQTHISTFKGKEQQHETESILKQLRQLLDRYNILRCENIKIPNTLEELQQFKKILKDCCTLLTEIHAMFVCDELDNVSSNYKEFLLMCKEISRAKTIVEEKICDIQSELLKSSSNALSQNEE